MADSFIQIPADSTGKKVDTRTESTNSEHREVHVIGDPSTNEGVAVVTNVDPVGEIYGVVVRNPISTTIAANTLTAATNTTTIATNTTKVVDQGDAASALRIVVAGNSAASVSATQVGSWTVSLSGALSSAVVTGTTLDGVADDGSASVKIGGVARTTNPSARSDGQTTSFTADSLGRQLTRPLQVRGLVATAYATLSTGTETTLLTAGAATYLDLIYIMAANTSSAAQQIDIREVSGGNVVMSLEVPASGTAGVALPVPYPQSATGNAWTADNADVTNSTVYVSALFSKEV